MPRVSQKVITLFVILFTSVNIFFASWYVSHNDISFISDVARDMFLLQEVSQKKLILIGPRSSVFGLYHGPLWTYLNYPAYVLGKGNPVAIGWYWIFLIVLFLIGNYWIANKLFNHATARLYVLMMSMYFIFHANELFNPHGALFVLPAFFYTIVRYTQTKKIRYLVSHVLLTGILIQFQMAIGAPMLILSMVYVVIFCIRHRTTKHLLGFGCILIPLSTFILFDLRHNFLLLHNIIRHLGTSNHSQTMVAFVLDRVQTILFRTEFLRYGLPFKFFSDHGQFIVTATFFFMIFRQITHGVHRNIYILFLYFYVGFFVVSLTNRYNLLPFYVSPLISLIFLMFCSLVTGKKKYIFVSIFSGLYILNAIGAYNYIQKASTFIGKAQSSWKGLSEMAKYVYEDAPKEFGYFLYAPDIMGYAPRYALAYIQSLSVKQGIAFARRPTTYLIIEPPAQDNRFTSEKIFKLSQIHLTKKPISIRTFPNGYKVEKYLLGPHERSVPFDPGINPRLHYR